MVAPSTLPPVKDIRNLNTKKAVKTTQRASLKPIKAKQLIVQAVALFQAAIVFRRSVVISEGCSIGEPESRG